MDKLFLRLVEKHTPKMTKAVVEGLACSHMKNTELYVDRVFKLAARSFPKGLVYLGYERCTPQEEYEETTKVKNNQRTFDLAPSYIYLVKYKFSFNGEILPDRYIHLPYVEEGGIISLGGARFHITPVLSDKVISPGHDSIFVRILSNKLTFKRIYHSMMVDGKKETLHVIWSQIYRNKTTKDTKRIPATTRAISTLAHYLFGKYGFDETFQRFVGFTPVVGEEEINSDSYPDTDWIICQSDHGNSQIKPKTYIGDFYKGTNIRLAIRKDKWNELTKALVLGFYYVVDHFPQRFRADPKYLNNADLWKILLGHILHSGLYGEDKLHTSIVGHYESINNYLDEITVEKLRERGYEVVDFYDLLALILSKFNTFVLDSEDSGSSMYGKNLEVLYYVLYNTTAGIFRAIYSLNKLSNKRELLPKDVTDMFKKNLRTGAIFKLSSGKIITESVSYSGDHKYIKLTSKITEQESLPGATRAKSKHSGHAGSADNMRFHVSMLEAGSFMYLAKKSSSPTNRVNPYVNIDPVTGTILPNPKFKDLRKLISDLIEGKVSL